MAAREAWESGNDLLRMESGRAVAGSIVIARSRYATPRRGAGRRGHSLAGANISPFSLAPTRGRATSHSVTLLAFLGKVLSFRENRKNFLLVLVAQKGRWAASGVGPRSPSPPGRFKFRTGPPPPRPGEGVCTLRGQILFTFQCVLTHRHSSGLCQRPNPPR